MPKNTQYALIVGVVVALVGLVGVGFAITRETGGFASFPEDTATTTESQRSGTPDSSGAGASVPTQAADLPLYDSDGTLLVHYRDTGFIPIVVSVKVGHSLRFKNISTKSLWVTSDANQSDKERYYRDLDQGKSIAAGQSFTLNMNSVGVFPFKNLNNAVHTGVVIVVP